MTKEKRRTIERKWRDLLKKREHMEGLVLELMRHPDTTAEELMKMRDVYTNTYRLLHEAEYAVETVLRTGKPLTKSPQ
jgi:predicted N-acyltransferase